MNLDEIKEMWSKDCEIDDIELDKSSLEVSNYTLNTQNY